MNFKQTVKLSQIEGVLFALMVASTESFLFYYAVKKNVSSFELAILTSLPFALGAIFQMIIPPLVKDKYLAKSVIITIMVQIIGVFGIFYTVAIDYSFLKLLIFSCIHFIGGLTSNPLWIDWAQKIVPKIIFRKYLASRNTLTWYFILFFYLLIAFFSSFFPGFNLIIIFLIGALARMFSCFLQIFISKGNFSFQVVTKTINLNTLELKTFKRINLLWVFIILTSLFRFTMMISAPFFVPYMINDLKLSMAEFIFLSAAPFLGRAISFKRWGKAGHSLSAFYSVLISLIGVSLTPFFWIISSKYYFLILFEIISGFFWGGLELCQVLMILNSTSEGKGSRVLVSIHMALGNIGQVLGASLGAYLLMKGLNFHQVIIFSSVLRLLATFFLIFLSFFYFKNYFNKIHLKKYFQKLFSR